MCLLPTWVGVDLGDANLSQEISDNLHKSLKLVTADWVAKSQLAQTRMHPVSHGAFQFCRIHLIRICKTGLAKAQRTLEQLFADEKENNMAATVAQMTKEELQEIIETAIEQKLLEMFGDPAESLD